MSRPWPWRREEAVPPGLRAAVAAYPLPEMLAAYLWGRGVEDPLAAHAFLQPTLADGLRSPDAVPGLAPAAAALEGVVQAGAAVTLETASLPDAVLAGAVLAGGLAAHEVAVCLEAEPVEPLVRDAAQAPCGVAVAIDGRRIRCGRPAFDAGSAHVVDAHGQVALSASGQAFYLLIALRRRLRATRAAPGPDLRVHLDLVALGTILGDVPLRDENRVLGALGLRAMHAHPRPGLRALLETAHVGRATGRSLVRSIGTRLAAALDAGATERVLALLASRLPAEAHQIAAALEVEAASRRRSSASVASAEAIALDAELSLSAAGPALASLLGRLEPHGKENPELTLLARGVRVDGAQLAGDPTQPYWRLRLRQDGRTVRATAIDLPAASVRPGAEIDVVFTPRLTTATGVGAPEIEVRAVQGAEATA